VTVVLFLELALFVFKFAAFSLLGNYSAVFWLRRGSTLPGTTIILFIDTYTKVTKPQAEIKY
jgi:hypothetical protein